MNGTDRTLQTLAPACRSVLQGHVVVLLCVGRDSFVYGLTTTEFALSKQSLVPVRMACAPLLTERFVAVALALQQMKAPAHTQGPRYTAFLSHSHPRDARSVARVAARSSLATWVWSRTSGRSPGSAATPRIRAGTTGARPAPSTWAGTWVTEPIT
jgi:hypothetical protein